MLGIILTLIAVLMAICVAFYYSDHPSARKSTVDSLFYVASKHLGKNPDRGNRQ